MITYGDSFMFTSRGYNSTIVLFFILTDKVNFLEIDIQAETLYPFLCGLHEVCSHIMVPSDLFICVFVHESQAPVTWVCERA